MRQHKQEQERFCKEFFAGKPNPGGMPHNDTYTRVPVVHSVGNRSFTFPMWVHKVNDIVSDALMQSGVWEPDDTNGVLHLLQERKQVSKNKKVAHAGRTSSADAALQVLHALVRRPALSTNPSAHPGVQANAADSRGPLLLDIGANLGWYSLQAAAMGFSVISVEPMASNLGGFRRTLCETPQLAPQITIVPKVVSRSLHADWLMPALTPEHWNSLLRLCR